MCLIIHIKKGVDKNSKFIEEAIRKAEEFNKDGMGYILKREDNSLFINKGFFDVDNFIESINEENVGLNDELTIHLRIGNKGETSPNMCHPFVISSDNQEIDEFLKGQTDKPVLMHNGTMYRYSVANSKKSDTYFFTRDVMNNDAVLNFVKQDSKMFDKLMQPHLSSSRLILVFPDQSDTILLGEWFEINGLLFSKDYNKEYFNKKVINLPVPYDRSHYSEYYHWDDYYDEANTDLNRIDYSDGLVEIPALKNVERPYFVSNFGVVYKLYMGLYLPIEEDFNDFVVEINSYNYKHARLKVIKSDYQLGVISNYTYRIDEVSPYYITVSCGQVGSYSIEIPISEFYELFSVKFSGEHDRYYREYYKLVKEIKPSKSLKKKITDKINKAIEKDFDTIVLHHCKKKYEIDLVLAYDFQYNIDNELEIQENPQMLLF